MLLILLANTVKYAGCRISTPPLPTQSMPAVPPELREWLTTLLQSALILAGVGLIMKRIDDLRVDNQRLDGKVDRLVEALAAKASSPPPRTTAGMPT